MSEFSIQLQEHRSTVAFRYHKDSNSAELSLRLLFELIDSSLDNALQQIKLRNNSGRGWVKGILTHRSDSPLSTVLRLIEEKYPLTLKAPFEGCDDIAGDVWRGSNIGRLKNDAIVKLRFNSLAGDLVAHAHEYSERFVIILNGEGYFHFSGDTVGTFSGRDMETVPVRTNDIISFSSALVHAFSSGNPGLTMLSYHKSFIELDDPKQYTIPQVRWFPRQVS